VAEFVSGDVVVVPFPFTDLQSSKRRPAVMLATFARPSKLVERVCAGIRAGGDVETSWARP
jgi:hypothetical protein